jgi:hypothetical protein
VMYHGPDGAWSAPRRVRISACKDLATLDRWLERAVTAASVSEVLAEPS